VRLLVSTPYLLDFESDQGKIVDANGVGTGLSYVSRPRTGTVRLEYDETTAGRCHPDDGGIIRGDTNSQDNARRRHRRRESDDAIRPPW
jgi:hypothetical protein